jgi:uncharacterized glyoxalase superfamily protein PhnB
MPEFTERSPFSPCPVYRDVKAALKWLQDAFGFEVHMVIADADDNIMHCEMTHDGGIILIAMEWTDDHKSPANLGGKMTSSIHVTLKSGIDAHCERARKAGAIIEQEPETQFYGDRTYRARDPEGHLWTFGMVDKVMSSEEWDKAAGGGVKTRTTL